MHDYYTIYFDKILQTYNRVEFSCPGGILDKMCPVNNEFRKSVAARRVSSLIQCFEKLGESGEKFQSKCSSGSILEGRLAPHKAFQSRSLSICKSRVPEPLNYDTSSIQRIDDLEKQFYFDNKAKRETVQDDDDGRQLRKRPFKKNIFTIRNEAKMILQKYEDEIILNDCLSYSQPFSQSGERECKEEVRYESGSSNEEQWENAVCSNEDVTCSYECNEESMEHSDAHSDQFSVEETEQFQDCININFEDHIYANISPSIIPLRHKTACKNRISLNTDSSHSTESLRYRQDSVQTEVGDEYAFLTQDPGSNWQSLECLAERADDDGEYCVLKPGTYVRTDSVENGTPIFQKVEIKCRQPKTNGTPNTSTSLCCYKETTILDANKNPRMTTISKFHVNSEALSTFVNTQKDKKEYIIDELIKTEETYINDLEYVIKNYMEFLSEQHKGCPLRRYKYIFINIEMIFEESKVFLEELQKSQYNLDSIGNTFIRNKNLFHRYPVYCKNKKTSQELIAGEYSDTIANREDALNDKLGLNSYLLKPIQRLAKYELLLKSLYKCMKNESRDTSKVKDAIKLVQKVARRGNDLIMIESIEDNPHSIKDTGEFYYKESFKMVSPKKMDIVLFLFHKMIIFANKSNKDKDIFNYKTYIPMEKLYKTTYGLTIELEDYFMRKKHKDPKYVLEVKDQEIKEKWIKCIDEILWEQLHKVKAEASQRDVDVTYKKLI